MRCCVCLNEKDRLIFDGRCSEGFCVDCVPSLGAQCPNCRQQFAWVKNNDHNDVPEVYEPAPDYEYCDYCRRPSDILRETIMYPGKEYSFIAKCCDYCNNILTNPSFLINNKVCYSTSVFDEYVANTGTITYSGYFNNDVLPELRLRFVHRLGVDYLDT